MATATIRYGMLLSFVVAGWPLCVAAQPWLPPEGTYTLPAPRPGAVARFQTPAPVGGVATTVQLPTFSLFTVNTTVSVPDHGGALLGGVGRTSTGSTAYSPRYGIPNRLMQSHGAAGQVQVQVQIHDFEALEAAIVEQAGQLPAANRSAPAGQAAGHHPPVASVAEARRAFEAERAAEQAQAERFVEHAEAASAEGKPNVARIYYQMAARRATGALLAEIQTRLRALESAGR